jgi:histidinol-phosphate/aromatic aminotransferase/cobyric acid decarboxylase-like protein
MVKLDAMENPFALPPELQRELGERLGRVALNRYPGQCMRPGKPRWRSTSRCRRAAS